MSLAFWINVGIACLNVGLMFYSAGVNTPLMLTNATCALVSAGAAVCLHYSKSK